MTIKAIIMYINYETKYEVGQKVYYLRDNKVEEAEIVGIRVSFKEGPHYDGSEEFEEFYKINDIRSSCLKEKDLERQFYLSKKDLLKHIVDQM